MNGAVPKRPGEFPTTHWSLIVAAGAWSEGDGNPALASLCSLYWYPLFAFARRRGHPAEEAQDLTQSFFTRLIEKGDFSRADQSRGRFRSFLLAAFQNFLSNERDRQLTQKRGGGQTMLSIDIAVSEERYLDAMATNDETPELLYERQWCLTLLENVLTDLRHDYVAAGNAQLFDRLAPYLTLDDDAGTYADAAHDLGMTPAAVKVAVHRLRRRYRDALRQRVTDTVETPDQIEDELRFLIATLSRNEGRM